MPLKALFLVCSFFYRVKRFVFQFGGNKNPGSGGPSGSGVPWVAIGLGACIAFLLATTSSKSSREITWREFVDMYLIKGMVSYVPYQGHGESWIN